MSVGTELISAPSIDAEVIGAEVIGAEVIGAEVIGAELTAALGPALGAAVFASPEVVAVAADSAEAELSWQERALCAQTDPESFFPEKGGSTREAKKVCTGCDVRPECLEYALAHDERFGIWGGLSERERRRLKKAAV